MSAEPGYDSVPRSLVIGNSLVIGHWSLVIRFGHWSFPRGHWEFTCHWTLVIGHFLGVIGNSLVIGHWSLVILLLLRFHRRPLPNPLPLFQLAIDRLIAAGHHFLLLAQSLDNFHVSVV